MAPEIRTRFIDYDARRDPKTDRYCVACQKDFKPGTKVRRVYVTQDMHAVHPLDLSRYDGEQNIGWMLIGNDCARVLGVEFTLPTEE